MVNKLLRYTRIIISIATFAILSAMLTISSFLIPIIGPWLQRIQIIPAIAALTLTTFVVWLLITLIFGRVYCSSVCPMGTLQDIASRATRLGCRKNLRPFHYQRPNNTVRYTMLGIMAVSLMLGLPLLISVLDPYSAFSRICGDMLNPIYSFINASLHKAGIDNPAPTATAATAPVAASIIATTIFVATVVISAQNGRILCNTICPVGATLGLVSRYSIFQIDIDTDKCIQCRRCEHVCKSSCIDLTDHVVDGSRCVNCFDCINVCPNDAIHYTATRKQLSIPMMQRITGIAPQKPSLGNTGTCACGDHISNSANTTSQNETIS